MPITKEKEDFEFKSIIKTHSEGLIDLEERIKALENKLGTHEKIAETLCETAQKQTKMQELLANTFIALLKTNDSIKAATTDLINKADRNAISKLFKKFGMTVWSILMLVIGGIITKIIQHY